LHADFKIYLALRHLKKEIKDIVYGYGPLEDLISTPSITEIMVVNRDRIYIERDGVIENSGRQFVSDLVTESIIQRMVNNVGAHIDRSKPMADARLKDGSRVNAVIQPTAVSGPCLTIRKFTTHRYGMKDLIETGSISAEAAEFLKAAVEDRRNIIVSGSTGTGKTTFLNILSACIPKRERVVTIEDTAELLLKMEHVVRLETKAENIEGKGLITIRDLVKNALRMRPDRIIVGECRSGEALDMLQAMNTGHDGSMTTIHANSASGVISRLEVLVQLAADSDLPVHTIHHQIASAVDLIVQLKRENNGRRHVVQIAECAGIDPVTQNIRLKDIFLASPYCELRPTGRLPSFLDRLLEHNLIGLDRFLPA
jgi:Flp pilus assembly CpaF family ATPase